VKNGELNNIVSGCKSSSLKYFDDEGLNQLKIIESPFFTVKGDVRDQGFRIEL